jgi:hypothetical protein
MIEHFLGSYPLDSVITQIATQTTAAAAAASRASGSGVDSRRSLDEAAELGTRLQRAMSAAGQLYRQAVEEKREFSSFIVTYLDLLLEKVVRPSLEQMTRGFITVLPEGDDAFHYYVTAYCHTEHELQIVAHGDKDRAFAVALVVRETIYILDSGEWAADVLVVAVPWVDVDALNEQVEEDCRDEMISDGENLDDERVLDALCESVAERMNYAMGEHVNSSRGDNVFITGSPRDDAARVAELLARLTLNKNMDVLEDLGVQRVDAEDEFDLR